MSRYLEINGDEEDTPQIASNTGWGDVCRAVESSSADLPILRELVVQGWVEDCSGITVEISTLLKGDLDPTVKSTLSEMADLLGGVSGMIGIV